ncbi:hypothetical protein AB0J74_32850 [Asanoa sp. NPDC049573]|uniref:hypothetical protein n=1 Tax=Asanoa sp. NPDC049573 TaxID=3155396 RepID=UPI00343EF890
MDTTAHLALIVIVDIENYSARTDTVQGDLRRSLYDLMRGAVADAALGAERMDHEDRGDAVMLFFHTASPVRVLGPLVDRIDQALRDHAERHTEPYRMRLRMAVHHGLIKPDDDGWVGSAINDAARLVDSQPVRAGLTDHPEAWLSVIVSAPLYKTVLGAGHLPASAAEWAPARAVVKNFDEPAWVRVPGVPQPPTDTTAAASDPVPPAAGPAQLDPRHTQARQEPARVGNQVFGGTFSGPTTFIGGDQHNTGAGR